MSTCNEPRPLQSTLTRAPGRKQGVDPGSKVMPTKNLDSWLSLNRAEEDGVGGKIHVGEGMVGRGREETVRNIAT